LNERERDRFPPQLFYDTTHAGVTVRQLLAGEVDIGVIGRQLTDEERMALEAVRPAGSRQATQLMLARSVIAVIVHQRNPVRQMTIEQVEEAYRNHDGNWRAFGAWDRPIDRIGTAYPLLSWSMFTGHVLKDEMVAFPDPLRIDPNHLPMGDEITRHRQEQRSRFPGGGPFPQYQDDRRVMTEIAGNVNAIGYCLMPADGRLPEGVRALSLAATKDDGACPPTLERIALDDYPLQNTLWVIVRPDASEQVRAFAEYRKRPAEYTGERRVALESWGLRRGNQAGWDEMAGVTFHWSGSSSARRLIGMAAMRVRTSRRYCQGLR
jgi:ABC-type phosphate transport system substrate-binding protein